MQSIFRLPWCNEQLNMTDKAGLDKMRPSPVIEIPLLSKMKRKLSESSEASSPLKKQQVEYPLQLLTPSSPYAHTRMFPNAEPAPSFAPLNSTPHRANASISRDSPGVQTVGAADHIRSSLTTTQTQATKERVDSGLGRGGYFMPKPVHDHTPDMAAQINTDSLSDLTPLQQVIENEFNMQILMKHNELRLIDQELAKCQIALEQLRRCELRPFPGSSQPASSVSAGTGPAIIPLPGCSRPSHAPPYGVTDGPYSQHYRRWLLQDPLFDSLSPRAFALAEHSSANSKNRSTRNNGHVRKTASKSLGSSARGSDAHHSIPNYPAPQPKDKNAPLVLRRSTDNQLVKLICNDCKRGNFSSIQGFLNHCRIAHKVDYKSHDAAAVDCGQLLEEHEMANLPLEIHNSSAPKPAPVRTPSVLTAPIRSSTFVHPFNTPAATPVNTPGPRPTIATQVTTPMPNLSISTPQSMHNASFKPSTAMPRLSALFTKHRVGGDLQQAVSNATQKVDLSVDDDALSPDTPGIQSPLVPFPAGKRMPLNGAGVMRPGTQDGTINTIARPQSRKGFRQPTQRPRPAPLAPALSRDHHLSRSTLSSPHDLESAGLSPNAADSNPGLVSDHEDDDHASASDEESPPLVDVPPSHPIQPVGRPCEDAMDIDVEEDDELDQHGVIIRRNSMVATDTHGYRSTGSPSRKMSGK